MNHYALQIWAQQERAQCVAAGAQKREPSARVKASSSPCDWENVNSDYMADHCLPVKSAKVWQV